jgi:hypothetical protein
MKYVPKYIILSGSDEWADIKSPIVDLWLVAIGMLMSVVVAAGHHIAATDTLMSVIVAADHHSSNERLTSFYPSVLWEIVATDKWCHPAHPYCAG